MNANARPVGVLRLSLGGVCLVLLLSVLVGAACSAGGAPGRSVTVGPLGTGMRAVEGAPTSSGTTSSTDKAKRATLLFGGDLLMHVSLGDSVLDPATGYHEFSRLFAPIAPYLKAADLSAANLETVLGGPEAGYSGYPLMNSPDDLAGELRVAGFDVVSTANNHALDQGWDGLIATLDALDAAGVAHVGTYRSATDGARLPLTEVNGIKIALLAYTDGLNGLPLPDGRPYAVALLDRAGVAEDVRRARSAGADVVVAMVHWGSEYMRQPSRPQREAAAWLVEEGVDVVVGSHPHVVQPIVALTVARASASATGYVAYSLGNLVSTQVWRYTDSGILLSVDVRKDDAGARVSGLRYLPVYVQRSTVGGKRTYLVVPVRSGGVAAWSAPSSEADRRRMAQVAQELSELLGGGPASPIEGSAQSVP